VQIGSVYLFLNQVDSASFYFQKLYEFEKKEGRYALGGYPLTLLGIVEAKRKNYAEALNYYWLGIPIAINNNNYLDMFFFTTPSQIYTMKREILIPQFTMQKKY
jgi:tetratricopeptide (TPR) repeat protein